MKKLTPRQIKFANEYPVDLNGTQAAIRAGYSPRSANPKASAMLKDPRIAALIAKKMDQRSERTEVTADRIVEELAKIAFGNIGDYVKITEDGGAEVDLSETTRDQLAALTGIESHVYMDGGPDGVAVKQTKIKMADKLKALEMLGRNMSIFNDKVRFDLNVDVVSKLKAGRRRVGMENK